MLPDTAARQKARADASDAARASAEAEAARERKMRERADADAHSHHQEKFRKADEALRAQIGKQKEKISAQATTIKELNGQARTIRASGTAHISVYLLHVDMNGLACTGSYVPTDGCNYTYVSACRRICRWYWLAGCGWRAVDFRNY